MIIEKAKLLVAKYRVFRILLVCVFVGIGFSCWKQLSGYYSEISETSKGIVGTFLGAVVGGCFTLLGSLSINKNAQKAVNAIKRKNIIYKPLYDELMNIHSEILPAYPYPAFIDFKKDLQTLQNHPQYTVWGRIKKDARIFEIPKRLKDGMEELYKVIEVYLEKRKSAVIALDRIYREEIQKIANRQIEERANVGESLLSYVLSGSRPDNDLLTWSFDPNNTKEADAMWESLQQSIKKDFDIKNCIDAKTTWNKVEEDVLELLGLYIQVITIKYEG